MPDTPAELETWVPLRGAAQRRLVEGVTPENRVFFTHWKLNGNRFEGDTPGSWLGDELEVPLWVWALAEAYVRAAILPLPLTFDQAVDLVAASTERRQALACMVRMGNVRPLDVFEALAIWLDEG